MGELRPSIISLLLTDHAIETLLMADPNDLVRREKQASHEPSTQVEWLTEKTIAIIAIIIGIIAIISDFFSK